MLDFNNYWSLVYNFLATHQLLAIGIAIAVLIFAYKKPVEAVKFFGFCAFLVAILYIMSLLTESGSHGVSDKKEMSTESRLEQLD
ncbi:MAG: hypothetical protein QNJ17_04070 [Desulfocapsaceae bacterium]|nr:hypothetical protein [Desulfocapsaceae bacterium]